MSRIRALTFEEIVQISGGGANGRDTPDQHHGSRPASTNYGGQANGFAGNTSAKNQGLGQGDCSNGVAGGLLGGIASGNPAGFAVSLAGGAISGGCFKGSNSNGNTSTKGGSNCSNSGIGGTCR